MDTCSLQWDPPGDARCARPQPGLPPVLGWPPDAPAPLEPAVRAGLARLARTRPDALAALAAVPGECAGAPFPLTLPRNPAYSYFGDFPALALVATLGQVRPDAAVDTAAAVLLGAWSASPRRHEKDLAPALAGGFRAVRHWATGRDGRRKPVALPVRLAAVLSQDARSATPGEARQVDHTALVHALWALALPPDEMYELGLYRRALSFLTGLREPDPRGAIAPTKATSHPVPPRHGWEALDRGVRSMTAGLDVRIARGYAERTRYSAAHRLPMGGLDVVHPLDLQMLGEYEPTLAASTRAAVLTAIYAGQDPDAMAEVVVARDVGEARQRSAAVGAEPGRTCLVLEPFGLMVPNRVNPVLAPGDGRRQPSTVVFVPWPAGPDHRLAYLAAWAAPRVGGVLFDAREVRDAKREVEAAAKVRGSAVRLGRLGHLLGTELEVQTGGAQLVQYLRNRVPDVRMRPALAYERFDLVEVASRAVRALSVLDRQLGGPGFPFDPQELPVEGFVGSLLDPGDEVWRQRIQGFAAACGPRPVGKPTPRTIRAFHNAYTDYTIALLSALSGIRPFKAGLAALEPLGDCWHANEKPQPGAEGRLIPVTPTAQRHWHRYAIHRRKVLEILARSVSGGTDRAAVADLPWAVFYLDAHGRPQPYTPAHWKAAIAPLVDNLHRHWLPNALRRRGWLADRRAHLMGHVGTIDRTTGRYSCIPPRWTRGERQTLEDLARHLGLVPVWGLGRV